MIPLHRATLIRSAQAALVALAVGGCSSSGDLVGTAFVDPARYDFFDCEHLLAQRKGLETRKAELQQLMDKAQTGVAGPVVAEVAYRADYVNVQSHLNLIADNWRRNRCDAAGPK